MEARLAALERLVKQLQADVAKLREDFADFVGEADGDDVNSETCRSDDERPKRRSRRAV